MTEEGERLRQDLDSVNAKTEDMLNHVSSGKEVPHDGK